MIRALVWMFGIQSAIASIIAKNGKILLTKRSPLLIEGGKWCLPGGGMKRWEKAMESAKREVAEEVGLKPIKVKLLFVQEEMVKKLKLHAHVFVFEMKCSGQIKTNWEVTEYGWFSRGEISKLDIAFAHRDILNKYFKLRSKNES